MATKDKVDRFFDTRALPAGHPLAKRPTLTDLLCADADGDFNHTCQRCDGEGEILVCWDDFCQGQGYCIHGDGYTICPACKGSGELK